LTLGRRESILNMGPESYLQNCRVPRSGSEQKIRVGDLLPLVQKDFRAISSGCFVREIKSLSPSFKGLFTEHEATRADKLGSNRIKAFAAARASLKELARELGLVDASTADVEIDTLSSDGIRPRLPCNIFQCSVSHDDRFIVVAADRNPLGVDVERVSDKVVRGMHIFMCPAEQDRSVRKNLDLAQAATRAWTAKEALAKALNINLLQSWREVQILEVDTQMSVVSIRGIEMKVIHRELAGHVFSMAIWDKSKTTRYNGFKN